MRAVRGRSGGVAAFLLALAVGAAVAASCKKRGLSPDGLPFDGPSILGNQDSGLGTGFSCGGSSDVSGTASFGDAGAIATSVVRAGLVGTGCNDPPGSIQLTFRDPPMNWRWSLTATIVLATDGGTTPLAGTHAVAAVFETPGAIPLQTSGTVVVTAGDTPQLPAAGAPISGSFQGTVSFSQDGLALSGFFLTPYCQRLDCFGR